MTDGHTDEKTGNSYFKFMTREVWYLGGRIGILRSCQLQDIYVGPGKHIASAITGRHAGRRKVIISTLGLTSKAVRQTQFVADYDKLSQSSFPFGISTSLRESMPSGNNAESYPNLPCKR